MEEFLHDRRAWLLNNDLSESIEPRYALSLYYSTMVNNMYAVKILHDSSADWTIEAQRVVARQYRSVALRG